MRYGTLIPEGGRLDLVGIDPAEQRFDADRLAAVVARLRPHVGDECAAAIEHGYPRFGGVRQRRAITERLAEPAGHGLGFAIHYFPEAAYDRSGIELFEREVIAAFS